MSEGLAPRCGAGMKQTALRGFAGPVPPLHWNTLGEAGVDGKSVMPVISWPGAVEVAITAVCWVVAVLSAAFALRCDLRNETARQYGANPLTWLA